jgi:alkanesulfonate monooxygenase SsuD/methylene tetrahydromethanopterin reductase-like flavin-dependent oxidoreductase (luciferase family)
MPLVWAHFIAHGPGQEIVQAYRDNYQPSEQFPEPVVMLATTAICAETGQDAAFAASSVKRWRATGPHLPIPKPAPPGTPLDGSDNPLFINQRVNKPLLHGTPHYVRSELETLAASFGTDEVLLVTITYDHAVRVRSYELLASEFDLRQISVDGQAETVTAG